jgi:hypothetical protein
MISTTPSNQRDARPVAEKGIMGKLGWNITIRTSSMMVVGWDNGGGGPWE